MNEETHYHGLFRLLFGIKQCPACSITKAKAAQYDLDRERRKTAEWRKFSEGEVLVAEDGTILEERVVK